jgi:hypothetical protein
VHHWFKGRSTRRDKNDDNNNNNNNTFKCIDVEGYVISLRRQATHVQVL